VRLPAAAQAVVITRRACGQGVLALARRCSDVSCHRTLSGKAHHESHTEFTPIDKGIGPSKLADARPTYFARRSAWLIVHDDQDKGEITPPCGVPRVAVLPHSSVDAPLVGFFDRRFQPAREKRIARSPRRRAELCCVWNSIALS
jgi:hypothetical protein